MVDTEESLATAKRSLAWATGVGPRHIPVAKDSAETGLATVPGVTLLEVGPANGGDVWIAVDSGNVHYTDRRLVFSGRRAIEFRFEDLTAVESRPDGLFVSVSSQARPHLLGGDSERLMAVLEACRSVAAGSLPPDPFESDIARLERMAGRARTDLEALTRARSELTAPPRPFSPAWMPLSLALVLVGALAALP
ncbi:hypothetical protein BH23ACT5_BH23ACT5_01510 [soil metagenome]